jgi:hypothetical protein
MIDGVIRRTNENAVLVEGIYNSGVHVEKGSFVIENDELAYNSKLKAHGAIYTTNV